MSFGWVILFWLPVLGVFVYWVAQNRGMAERDMGEVEASQQHFDQYVRSVAGSGGAAEGIDKAKQLLDKRCDHAGRVRCDQGQGARVAREGAHGD
ncbi:MAG TPA: hypothetical protein VFI46_09865 [Jiangellaceae bacterium]|nr:hypothetical protein [Jiangellaceae bacterium]